MWRDTSAGQISRRISTPSVKHVFSWEEIGPMLRLRLMVCAALCLLLSAESLSAATKLRAVLRNSNEPGGVTPTSSNGGPRPVSFGTAIFVLNDAQTAMTMWASVHNIDFGGQTPNEANDNLTAAHIHGSDAGNNPPPATRGVVWGFLGTPDNDNNPDDLVVMPFTNKAGAIVTSKWDLAEGNGTNTLANNISRILTERTYLNFHTSQFTGGEIRGNLVVIPEPASAMLLLSGLALIIGMRRKR
jgi:hypothetical protein